MHKSPSLLELTIATSAGVVYQDLVTSVKFVDHFGQIMLFKDYGPYIGVLQKGELSITLANNQTSSYWTGQGAYQIAHNKAFVFVAFCLANTNSAKQAFLQQTQQNLQLLQTSGKTKVIFDKIETQIYKELKKAQRL